MKDQRTVGVSRGVVLYALLLWLMVAALFIGAWIITLNEIRHRDSYGEYGGESLASLLVTLGELTALIALTAVPLYRYATRSLRIADDKLIARGFWRTRVLSWDDVHSIVCSPFERLGPRAFTFAGANLYVSGHAKAPAVPKLQKLPKLPKLRSIKVSSSFGSKRYVEEFASLVSSAPDAQKQKFRIEPSTAT